MKSMLAILAACFLLTACRAGSDDAVAPDNAYGSRSLRLGADPYVAPEGSVITLEAELSNAVAGKTVSFFVVQGQAILERATAQTNQYGKAVITATLASPGPIKFKATCVGYGVAYTEVLTEGVVVEIDGYVYGEPNRKIDNMVQRYTNDDPHDDVNLITRGYVKFVADIQTAGQPPANLAYEWPVSGGQSETDIYRDDLDWNAPADETEVSIILMVFQGGILFGNNQAAAKAVGPRVARVKFEGDGAITLLDEDKGKIEPPQYDRFDTTWETGHEADLNHDHLKNAEGKLFKNESVAYVRGGQNANRR